MADLSRIPKSKYIQSFTFVGDRYPYPVPEIKGDSYPMTWADDGEIYASSGDPNWGETTEGLDVEKFSGMAPDYVITKANHMNDYDGSGGDGPKPTGMICVDGVLLPRIPEHAAHQGPALLPDFTARKRCADRMLGKPWRDVPARVRQYKGAHVPGL